MSQNLVVFQGSIEAVTDEIWKSTDLPNKFHITHSEFLEPAEMIIPVVLSGFEFIDKNIADKDGIFVIAANSDVALIKCDIHDDPTILAMETARILAQKFFDRKIFLVSYDGGTPMALHRSLSQADLELESFFNVRSGCCDVATLSERKSHLMKNFDTALRRYEITPCNAAKGQTGFDSPVPPGI